MLIPVKPDYFAVMICFESRLSTSSPEFIVAHDRGICAKFMYLTGRDDASLSLQLKYHTQSIAGAAWSLQRPDLLYHGIPQITGDVISKQSS